MAPQVAGAGATHGWRGSARRCGSTTSTFTPASMARSTAAAGRSRWTAERSPSVRVGVPHQVGAGDYVSILLFGPRLGGYPRATVARTRLRRTTNSSLNDPTPPCADRARRHTSAAGSDERRRNRFDHPCRCSTSPQSAGAPVGGALAHEVSGSRPTSTPAVPDGSVVEIEPVLDVGDRRAHDRHRDSGRRAAAVATGCPQAARFVASVRTSLRRRAGQARRVSARPAVGTAILLRSAASNGSGTVVTAHVWTQRPNSLWTMTSAPFGNDRIRTLLVHPRLPAPR